MFPSPIFPSRRRALVGAAALALLSSFAVDTANAYPDRPIKIIVTFPPGGSADIVIRALRPVVSETLCQTIIIENKSGAGGNVRPRLSQNSSEAKARSGAS